VAFPESDLYLLFNLVVLTTAMKRIVFLLLVCTAGSFLSSCSKEDYSVRFKNDYKEAINNISAGNARLGRADSGQTTDYKSFSGHSFIISGQSDSGLPLNETESVSGKGKHKWTITLNHDGTIDFAED
jgi:hypothetical protein